MPGNGAGDRVHNFFAQENLSLGPRSQAVDVSWSLNDNLWGDSQKQFGVSDSSLRNYNLQQSEFERGHSSQRIADPLLFNITQTAERPEFTRSLSHREHPNSNGYMYENQNFQAKLDEANFMGVNTEYGRNNVNQRGFPFYESKQEAVSEETPKNPFRLQTSEAQNGFDLFGGQQQMNSQYPGMLQPLQQQQSGFGDIQQQQQQQQQHQQLQHQLMLRKMQELQRQELQNQEDLRQREARQQSSLNQVSALSKQASGSQSHGLVNGIPTSDPSGYAWSELASGNTNWLQRASPAMQGSVSGPAFQGQPHRSVGFPHQQVDQSLYGVPVSSSRGSLNQYAHIAAEKSSIQQLPTYGSSFPGNHYAATQEQLMLQNEDLVGRQGLTSKSVFGNISGQGSNSRKKIEHVQQLEAPQNTSGLGAHAAQDLNGPASLDPDEEKILFGSDDNIWEAFGSSKNTGGVSSLLDDKEFASGLPSLQSGSWSALMQSAVAETSGSGAGLQEEWPDLNFQNPDLSSGKHPPTHEGNGKHQKPLGDINSPNALALSSLSVLADGANMNDQRHSNMGFQHHGKNNPYERDEGLNVNYSKQTNQHSSGGNNWLSRGASQKVDVEDSRVHRNSVSTEIKAKAISGHWASQQHGTIQSNNKQNHWKANESVPSVDTGFNINERNNSSQQQPQSNDWNRAMHDEMGQGDGTRGVNAPFHQREPVDRGLATPNLSIFQGDNHSNQFAPNNHHLTYWKHVDSSAKSKGSEKSEKSQRLLSKGPQVSESSFNSFDKEDLKMHEMESSSRRENSNDSHRSSSSHHPNTVGLRDTFLSDAGDSKSFSGPKKSLSNQAGRRTSAPRKFQYHPMGNLDEDVEMPHGTRQGNNMSLQRHQGFGGQDQGNFGHTKTSIQDYVPGLEGVPKGSDDMHFKGMIPGHVHNIFAPNDRSVGLPTSDKASQPSQNMLELLHKVDQSRDRGVARQLNSSERNLSSEMPEPEHSDGSFGGHHRSQSSNSQGIGLQLGPPSQLLPSRNHASPRAMQTGNTDSRGRVYPELSSFSSFQETSRGEFKNSRMGISGQSASETKGNNMMTKLSASVGTDFPSSRIQNHQMIGARGQVCTDHSGNESFDGRASQIGQAERVQATQPPPGEKLLASQPRANSDMTQQGGFPKVAPKAWRNLPPQQLLSATQACKGESNIPSSHQLNIVESTFFGQRNLEEQEAEKRQSNLSKCGARSTGEQLSKESPSLNPSIEKADLPQMMNGQGGNMPFSNAQSQRDFQAFGRSLKSNDVNERYSLLNQMKAMKNADSDLNNKILNRVKDSDDLLGGQQVAQLSEQPREQNNRLGDASVCRTTPGDSETPMLTTPTESVEQNVTSLPAGALLEEAHASDQNGAQSCIPVKMDHSHISPQMAPSWFDKYGTFKTGQLAQRADVVKTVEQPLSIGRVSGSLEAHDSKEQASIVSDTSQAGIIKKTSPPSSLATEQLSSPSHANVGVQDMVTLRSKKRKCSTYQLHPWIKEVLGAFKNLQGICTSSMGWCKATNRLMEKVDDDGEVIEDALPVSRPKRRIILTTQLMQQLFFPPPAIFLSTDATSSYESVTFYAARLGLGDACNLVSSARSYSSVSPSGSKSEPERTNNRLSEVVVECTSKANRLENDFSRLDKRASICDLRVECQDLEKFSIFNRFAKFHSRAQTDGGGGSGNVEVPSSDAAASTLKPTPQRYVTAVTFPKDLPERVQCLSL